MNHKQEKILALIFERPVQPGIPWADIESLLAALGAVISEGSGSRIRIELNGHRAVFHRPHSEKTTDRGAVKAVCMFLESAGVKNVK